MRTLLLLLTLNLFALHQAHTPTTITEPKTDIPLVPWLTGPIFSPTPINMTPGHPGIEPNITFLATYGDYQENWSVQRAQTIWGINLYVDFQLAFTDRTGLEIQAQSMSSWQGNASSTRLMDTNLLFGYQILEGDPHTSTPNLRLDLQVTLPTGSYQHLNPKNNGLDAQGAGAYQFGPLLIAQKFFYIGQNLFGVKGSALYLFPLPTHVSGLNTYETNPATRTKIHVGQTLQTYLNLEYSLTQKLALTLDAAYTYQKKSTNQPPKTQFTLAPQLEYSTSPNTGYILGAWLTPAGRNTPAFASLTAAIAHLF